MALEPIPGVFVEQMGGGAHTIVAAPTSVAAFVGYSNPATTAAGDYNKAVEIESYREYQQRYGNADPGGLARAVNAFFSNGGSTALIVAIKPAAAGFAAADFVAQLHPGCALDTTPFNLLAVPGVTDAQVVAAALLCAQRSRAFLVVDPPRTATAAASIEAYAKGLPASADVALYFPWLKASDPAKGAAAAMPPSGFVTGVYARIDVARGVWKAPAGMEATLEGTTGPVVAVNDAEQAVLNPAGINCLRTFPAHGTVVWGARTLAGDGDGWQYVSLRRTQLFVEQSLYAGLQWVVFEPNDPALWASVVNSVNGFLMSLFREGAFQGAKPSDAFFVKCDATTMTQADIDNGRLIAVVGMALLRPAEFEIFQIGLWTQGGKGRP